MSDLTTCNYCSFQGIKDRARKSGMKVTVKPSTGKLCLGGVDVLVHPPNVEPNRDLHFRSWFMELPDRCCC